jgi:hypothetical protein
VRRKRRPTVVHHISEWYLQGEEEETQLEIVFA